MSSFTVPALLDRYARAKSKHDRWVGLWQECYDYALPQRAAISSYGADGSRRGERLYDATALDSVDQLASLMLGNLTPPLTPWFGLKAGTDLSPDDAEKIRPALEKTAELMRSHFDRSNFIVELHQCFLDLVTAGTASLMLEEAMPGELSAFRFTAVPLGDILTDETRGDGKLDTVFRTIELSPEQWRLRYDDIDFTPLTPKTDTEQHRFIECVLPETDRPHGFRYLLLHPDSGTILSERRLPTSPFINFRWMKSPREIYGRSPVMKALPDIKTANKVVELILKNASISVTGIWQAEDDGVLNLSNIELVPGAIIPKAVGSKGLTPLEMPARFDVSQLVLEDLRSRIRHALLADRLPQIGGTGGGARTATEITERSNEMTFLLGATFGRLQVELLDPLIRRAYALLRQRGAIPDLPLDGRTVAIDYRSPLARAQSARSAQSVLAWMNAATGLGSDITDRIDKKAVLAHLTELLGVPEFLIPETTITPKTGE